ncbi:Unconventional myosin-IXa [Takifugu flavidus]|uniref:Unconventional myosin-IXa n=1 Tax=Takifugu flavidus TaxID=433684 RepID=A0A5C6NM52_9TELE|nr:Unconventional myosin-IXa [Takifugu flavidus]
MSARDGVGGVRTLGRRQRFENSEITVRIYPGALAEGTIYCPISARKTTTAAEAIERVIERLQLDRTRCYVLAEVKEFGGEEWILNPCDCPVQRMMLWPRVALEQRPLSGGEDYRFLLRQKNLDGSIHYGGSLQMWLQVTEERRRMVERGLLPQPDSQGDHADLCHLPELNERSLLDNLRSRFLQEKIYTYVGSILIVINPFKFLPIYNPKYVKMYDNHALGKLEPHIYAVADVAYHTMLQRERNQCIVISGESGSGKTQSTNFLIHHLTALSQKGFASGVEQIILGAGPVLEHFQNPQALKPFTTSSCRTACLTLGRLSVLVKPRWGLPKQAFFPLACVTLTGDLRRCCVLMRFVVIQMWYRKHTQLEWSGGIVTGD